MSDPNDWRYLVATRWGDDEDEPSVERMQEILAELDENDVEHPSVWLKHRNGWTLDAYEGGTLLWSNMNDDADATRHMRDVPRERVLALWQKLAAGAVDEIEREPWVPGNGARPWTAEQQAELDAMQLEQERAYYDGLGPESDHERCNAPGCTRGVLRYRHLCRTHCYESLMGRPCPFSH